MLATIRTAPPQWMQMFTSMPKTRLRRCAHADTDVGGRATHGAVAEVIERRRSVGVRGSAGSGGVSSDAFDGRRLPRPEGVNRARNFAFGANMP
jgi:hypothetical protein